MGFADIALPPKVFLFRPIFPAHGDKIIPQKSLKKPLTKFFLKRILNSKFKIQLA